MTWTRSDYNRDSFYRAQDTVPGERILDLVAGRCQAPIPLLASGSQKVYAADPNTGLFWSMSGVPDLTSRVGEVARNTILADFCLASMKILVGMLSGSVGILADGADSAIDTASAAAVSVGLRMKKQTIMLIAMMLVCAAGIGYDSATKLIAAAGGTLSPISRPYLVIGAETVALFSAVFLYLYQRAAGRRNGSLTLMSQSVDSKNHVFVSIGVICGAALSILGTRYVDALIGGVIALDFLRAAIGLYRKRNGAGAHG